MERVADRLFEELEGRECLRGSYEKSYCEKSYCEKKCSGVILVGHCCSGKSTLAKQLYQIALKNKERFSKVTLWDSDIALLEAAWRQGSTARTISELYIQEGATAFRLKESQLILNYLHSLQESSCRCSCYSILSLGAGALSYMSELAPGRWERLSEHLLKVALLRSGYETYKSHQERWKSAQSRAYLAKPFPSLGLWSSRNQHRSILAMSRADYLAFT